MTEHRRRREAGLYEPKERPAAGAAGGAPDLDAMTKAELLAHAEAVGVTSATGAMTKSEIRAEIDAA